MVVDGVEETASASDLEYHGIQIHTSHSAHHRVVHRGSDGAQERAHLRLVVCAVGLISAVVLAAGNWEEAPGSAQLTEDGTEELCGGCIPLTSAGVARQAHKVAAAQSQIRVLYDSANGKDGPGLFRTEDGAPLYAIARGSLTSPAADSGGKADRGTESSSAGGATSYIVSTAASPQLVVGYHLVWVPDSDAGSGDSEAARKGWKRINASPKDELPFFPVPEKYSEEGGHAKWVEDDCDDGTKEEGDPECEKKWRWTDHYPHRELVTQTFPYGHYVPDNKYPYIRGPYHHHLENGNGNQYVDHGGHWVWVSDSPEKLPDHFVPPKDKYQPPPYGQRG